MLFRVLRRTAPFAACLALAIANQARSESIPPPPPLAAMTWADLADLSDSAPLVARPLGHLFGANVTRVAFKRSAYLRHFVYAFAELLSDNLSAALIQRAMSGTGDPQDYDL